MNAAIALITEHFFTNLSKAYQKLNETILHFDLGAVNVQAWQCAQNTTVIFDLLCPMTA